MTDFAHLGMTFSTTGADQAVGAMKKVESQAKAVEAATQSASASYGKVADAASASGASLEAMSRALDDNRRAALGAAEAAGELRRVVNPTNGVVSFVPQLAKDASAAKTAVRDLGGAVRDGGAANENAARSATAHAQAVRDVASAAAGAAAQTLGWAGSITNLLTSFTAFGIAQAAVQALAGAIDDARRESEAFRAAVEATDTALRNNAVALAGARTEADRLADAYLNARVEASKLARAQAEAEITKIQQQPQRFGLGNFAPAGFGEFGAGIVSGQLADARQAAVDALRSRVNRLLGQESQIRALDARNKAQAEANRLVDEALPREKALRDLAERRAAIQKDVAAGLISQSTGQKAVNALDAEAVKIAAAHSAARTAHTRAVRAHTAALSDEAKALRDLQRFSANQDERLATFGMSAADVEQVEALARANEALSQGHVQLAAHIANTAARLAELRGVERLNADANPTIIRTAEQLQDAWRAGQNAAGDWTDKVLEAAEAAQAFQGAVEAMASALRHGDFVGAAADFARVAQSIQAALRGGQRVSAIGMGASALGGVIGGRAGGVLSGFGSGVASASALSAIPGLAALGGPVGLIAGGLLGGIGSLFGGGKSRQQRRDEQNQAAAEKAQKAQEIANQKKQLELRLIELSGDKVAYLAAQRQDELAGIDATNKALQQQVYDAEDAAARQATVRSAEEEYLKLTGQDLALLNRQRDDELKAIDKTLIPLQKLVYAAQDAAAAVDTAKQALQAAYDAEMERLQSDVAQAHDDLAAAYNREAGALTDTMSKFRQFGATLHDFRRQLDAGATGLSPENAYNAARSRFLDVSRRAQLGDAAAMSDFAGAGEAFRQASAAYNGVSGDYFKDLAAIKDATDAAADTADRTADVAEQQLDQLKDLVDEYLHVKEITMSVDEAVHRLVTAEQALANTKAIVDPLLGINGSIMSLGQAIAGYQAAVAAQAASTQALADAVAAAKANPANTPPPANPAGLTPGYTSTNGDYAAYVEGNPDLKALFDAQQGMARGRTEAEFGMYHFANFGINESRPVRPYAHGGDFMVGGSGGTDSQRVEFLASPDERVTIRTPEQMARDAAAMERMAAESSKTNALLDQIVYELRADKTQRTALGRLARAGQEQVVDALETFKRRSAA